MPYIKFELKPTDEKDIITFISFSIATARSQKYELLKFEFSSTTEEKQISAFKAKLKALKKKGSIDCAADIADFSNGVTEAYYILNKFPEISNEISNHDNKAVFVKI